MKKVNNKIAVGLAAVTMSSLCGCNLFEEIPRGPKNSYIIKGDFDLDNESVDDSLVSSQVDYMAFSDVDKEIYNSLKSGYEFLIRKNNYTSWNDILMFQLGKEFQIYKDRYESVFDVTIEKYSEAINYYESGNAEEFQKCYFNLLFNDKYLNVSDLINIMSSKVNTYAPGSINDSSNYQFGDHEIYIDGVNIKGLVHEQYDKTEVVEIMDFFDKYSSYQRGEYSSEKYASYAFKYVPYFVSCESNKTFNPTRLGIDEVSGQIYSYNNMQLSKIVRDQKKYLSQEYDVSNWKYNREYELYFVFNDDGFGSVLENGSLCERYIDGIDYTENTLLQKNNFMDSNCDSYTFNYSKFENFYEDCLDCRLSNKLVK